MKWFIRNSFFFIFLLVRIFSFSQSQSNHKFILLGNGIFNELDKEQIATFTFLKKEYPQQAIFLSPAMLKNNPEQITDSKVLWFHKCDSISLNINLKDSAVIHAIKQFIFKGGSLLLTQEAVDYLVDLGFEKSATAKAYRKIIDQGYGRKSGLHAYREHPVFSGLYGGSYLSGPISDTTLRIRGFFNDDLPLHAKVLAVEWNYLTLSEDSKLMWEYNYGKGKVLCIGAFTSFSATNTFKDHLELFLKNTLQYISAEFFNEKENYWDYSVIKKIESNLSQSFLPPPNSSQTWQISKANLHFSETLATKSFFDLAGRRLLLTGKENAGIDEIWVHPFMIVKNYKTGIKFNSESPVIWLDSISPLLDIRPECIIRTYKFKNANLKEIITVSPYDAAAVIHYEYQGISESQLLLSFDNTMRLMWPYSEKYTSVVNFSYNENLRAFQWRNNYNDFHCLFGFNKMPEKINTNSLSVFNFQPKDNMDVIITASVESLEKTQLLYSKIIENPENVYHSSLLHYDSLFNNSLILRTNDTTFNEGYRWALVATDRFLVNTPGIGTSLMAGYGTTDRGWDGGHKKSGRPGYAWYFGRDAAWSGMAINGYGDFKSVKNILNQYIRFQDISGKIYHELTSSGVVYYDAADASPLFIVLAGRYIRQSGDTAWLHKNWPSILKTINYCYSTDWDHDTLIENSLVGHGWVEGGKLLPVHSEIYLAGCWAAALDNAAYLASVLFQQKEVQQFRNDYIKVKEIINRDFWNEKEQFFSFGKYKDKTYNTEKTVLPAVPMLFGLTDSLKSSQVLKSYAANSFTSDWGVRILSEESTLYSPSAYHYGSVWPLFTGWTSLAEYKYNRPIQGFEHLMQNLLGYKFLGKGMIEEVLDGEEYKPAGVCSHQCWSETMVLQPSIDGMLGLDPDALNHILNLNPQIPPQWTRFQANNIRVGGHLLHLLMERKGNQYIWTFIHSGSQPLLLRFKPAFPDGTEITKFEYYTNNYSPFTKAYNQQMGVNFPCRDTVVCVFTVKGGVSVLPLISQSKPESQSNGFRILEAKLYNNVYTIELQGKTGSKESFTLFMQDETPGKVLESSLIHTKNNYFTFETQFSKSKKRYSFQQINIPIILKKE